jgi:hypothetical protein
VEAAGVLNVDVAARESIDGISDLDFGRKIAALVGDLADAAEKIDHLEEFSRIAKKAVRQLLTVIEAHVGPVSRKADIHLIGTGSKRPRVRSARKIGEQTRLSGQLADC